MPLSSKPKKSKYQVGDTVHFLEGSKASSSSVVKVLSSVTNPLNDSLGVQENDYFLMGREKRFEEGELFHSANALMYDIKGDWLCKFGNGDQVVLTSGSLLGNCDFSYSLINSDPGILVYFLSSVFTNCNFEGSDLGGIIFTACELNNCSFRFSNLAGAILEECNIANSNFTGAILTGATLPANADTKSTFKSVVGAGHWDADTTIWIDGSPIRD